MTFPGAGAQVYNVAVSTTAAIVAYARGYRAGRDDDGFTEAVEKIQRDTEKGFD